MLVEYFWYLDGYVIIDKAFVSVAGKQVFMKVIKKMHASMVMSAVQCRTVAFYSHTKEKNWYLCLMRLKREFWYHWESQKVNQRALTVGKSERVVWMRKLR